jgi:hypothetical protein
MTVYYMNYAIFTFQMDMKILTQRKKQIPKPERMYNLTIHL